MLLYFAFCLRMDFSQPLTVSYYYTKKIKDGVYYFESNKLQSGLVHSSSEKKKKEKHKLI